MTFVLCWSHEGSCRDGDGGGNCGGFGGGGGVGGDGIVDGREGRREGRGDGRVCGGKGIEVESGVVVRCEMLCFVRCWLVLFCWIV